MAAVHAAGGPHVPTQVRAEGGKLGERPKKVTFARYDSALCWVEGSAAAAYYNREQPVIADEPRSSAPLRLTGSGIDVSLDRILALMDIQRELNAAADAGEGLAAARVRDLAARLDHEVSLMAGKWATYMLERNRGQGGSALETVLSDVLSAPVGPDSPGAEDRMYRRWLLGGRAAAEVGPQQEQKFKERYRASEQGGESDAD
ncbi:hypothetical protein [Nocardia sp. NPDC004860]|uniref:hypothetical protein n=1 Tax=Nocardia sp. NPDC004860 TaxID=3154557 RepID=UPI0033B6588A